MKTKTIELAVIDNELYLGEQFSKVIEEYNEFLAEFSNDDFRRDLANYAVMTIIEIERENVK